MKTILATIIVLATFGATAALTVPSAEGDKPTPTPGPSAIASATAVRPTPTPVASAIATGVAEVKPTATVPPCPTVEPTPTLTPRGKPQGPKVLPDTGGTP